jgi:hypothetical protein
VDASDERRAVKTRTVPIAAALAVLLLALGAVASACGSSSSGDGVAALDDAASTTTAESTDSSDGQDTEEAALAWAKCMREHGVDVPDPQVGDNGQLTIRAGSRGRSLDPPDSDAFQKAQKACGTPFGRSGRPPISPEQREQFQEAMLAFAKCMREHGVDMPDPQFSGEGGAFRAIQRGGSGFDPDSPTFQEAQKACQPIIEEARPDAAGSDAGTDEKDDG